MADIAHFAVRFDEEAFAEDLEHATAAGREVAVAARLEREGVRDRGVPFLPGRGPGENRARRDTAAGALSVGRRSASAVVYDADLRAALEAEGLSVVAPGPP